MRSRLVVGLVVALMVGLPTVAEAGAPNYECGAGPWRFAIDQHRRAGLVRLPDRTVVETALLDGNQNGSALTVTLLSGSLSLESQITGTGKSLTLTVQDGVSKSTYTGFCAFVPGNFILGYVTDARLAVRTRASWNAPVFATASRHSLVWAAAPEGSPSVPDPMTHSGWARVRVVSTLRSGSQGLGIGTEVGLDGPSTVAQGWGRVDVIHLVTARS